MRRPRLLSLALTVLLGGATAGLAAAEEVRTPIRASMFLDLVTVPVEPRADAFDRALREDGPPPAAGAQVLPDGSVRYGSATLSVTLRNPCPPGSLHDEPRPLPGRRARN